MLDHVFSRRERFWIVVGYVAFIVVLFGGIEYVRHCTTLCDSLPAVAVNACKGR